MNRLITLLHRHLADMHVLYQRQHSSGTLGNALIVSVGGGEQRAKTGTLFFQTDELHGGDWAAVLLKISQKLICTPKTGHLILRCRLCPILLNDPRPEGRGF